MTHSPTIRLLSGLVLSCGAMLFAPLIFAAVTVSGATTVTNSVVFHRGLIDFFLGNYFTYSYTVNTTISHNDIHIGFVSAGDMDIGSYSGVGTPSFAGNTLAINSPTAMPSLMTFSIDTTRNPNSLTGSQSFSLTQDTVTIPGTEMTLPSTSAISTGFLAGSILLNFIAGTFDPFAEIDLFQNNSSSLYIGYGAANGDGSATVSLIAPLIAGSDFLISQNGNLAFHTSVINEPSSWTLVFLSAVILMRFRRRYETDRRSKIVPACFSYIVKRRA